MEMFWPRMANLRLVVAILRLKTANFRSKMAYFRPQRAEVRRKTYFESKMTHFHKNLVRLFLITGLKRNLRLIINNKLSSFLDRTQNLNPNQIFNRFE